MDLGWLTDFAFGAWGWVVGLVLLLGGRRLYWFLAGVVGFGVGFFLASQLFDSLSNGLLLLVGCLVGIAGAVLAVAFQRLVLAIVGFVAAAYLCYWALGGAQGMAPWWLWAACVLAGLAGALVFRWLFEVALVVVSSLVGARLLVEAIAPSPANAMLVFAGLAAFGMLFQAALAGRRRHRNRGER